MSNAELFYAAVVLLVGVPSAVRISFRPLRVRPVNLTAAALVLSYLFMQGSYYGLGLTYPPEICFFADATVIAMMYAKRPERDLMPYETWQIHVAAFWLEKSLWDRIVLVLFPVGWLFYAFAAEPYWPLWYISLAQLLAAGMEALEVYRSKHSAKAGAAQQPENEARFRLAEAGAGAGG